jgi:hypothetical protein
LVRWPSRRARGQFSSPCSRNHGLSVDSGRVPHSFQTRDIAFIAFSRRRCGSGAFKLVRTGRPTIPRHQVDGSAHNNKMERMNGEVRDREKTMRGLKNSGSPILKGMQIHYSIKPHMGLDGKTPAEAAGIRVEGEDKWLTIMQNASRNSQIYT